MEEDWKSKLTEEELKAWTELWEYAQGSISINDIGIDFMDFIEGGVELFDIKVKN